MRTLRVLLFGVVAGGLCSWLRAPAGLDLVHAQVPGAWAAAAFRAAALIVIALSVGRARLFAAGVSAPLVVAGIALGFALHGGLLEAWWRPQSRVELALGLVAFASALWWLGRSSETGRAADEEPGPGGLERGGLALAGAGALLAIEALARRVRLFGLALPEDDTVFASVFLVVAAVLGAGACAAPLRAHAAARGLAPALLALVPLAALLELAYAEVLCHPDAFESFLRSWGQDTSVIGTLGGDGQIGLRLLSAPALAAGTAVGLLRNRTRLASVLLGAALAQIGAPLALARVGATCAETTPLIETATGRLLVLGAWLAGLGAALATARGAGLGRGARGVALIACLVLMLLAARPSLAGWRPGPALALSPWGLTRTQPTLLIDAPEGLLTVEPSRSGLLVATLDRLRLTPLEDEIAGDLRRIRSSWSLLERERREAGEARVLFVGQLTPDRSLALDALGAGRIERTSPWHAHADLLERELFRDSAPPVGALVPPAEARARIAAGEYDLVIVAAPIGPTSRVKSVSSVQQAAPPVPVVGGLAAPPDGVAVVWIDGRADLGSRELGTHVVLSLGGAEDLTVGVVLGAASPDALVVDAGAPGPAVPAWRRLTVPLFFREYAPRAALAARLARAAAPGTELAGLTRGLELHFAAQEPSSPFETHAQGVEVSREGLGLLCDAALALPAHAFLTELWEDLAVLLVLKRMPDLIHEHVLPLAEARAPAPVLARAVARAFQEFAMPAEAVPWLERALAERPYDIGLLVELAGARSAAGDGTGAVEALREALAIQPGRADLERLLGIALVRADRRAEGLPLLEAALARDPDDDALRPWLAEGPPPELGTEFLLLAGDPETW